MSTKSPVHMSILSRTLTARTCVPVSETGWRGPYLPATPLLPVFGAWRGVLECSRGDEEGWGMQVTGHSGWEEMLVVPGQGCLWSRRYPRAAAATLAPRCTLRRLSEPFLFHATQFCITFPLPWNHSRGFLTWGHVSAVLYALKIHF